MSSNSTFTIRLSKAAKEFNVSFTTIQEFLAKKGFQIDTSPTTKLSEDMYVLLVNEFQGDRIVKNKADELSDFYYKGDSIILDSTIENKRPKRLLSTNDSKDKAEMTILLSSFSFGNNTISRKIGRLDFVLMETGISSRLNTVKSIKNKSTKILVDFDSQSFQFLDTSLLSDLKNLSALLEKEKELENAQHQIDQYLKKETKSKKEKEKQIVKTRIERKEIEHIVTFSELRFGQGRVTIVYNKKHFLNKNNNIRDFDKKMDLVYRSVFQNKEFQTAAAIKKKIQKKRIKVLMDDETKTFVFKDFDICIFVNRLMDIYLPENNRTETIKKVRLNNAAIEFEVSNTTIREFLAKKGYRIGSSPNTILTDDMYALLLNEFQKKNLSQNPLPVLKTMSLGISNIHFYNGYYVIFQTTNGEIDHSIAPLRVDDPDSHEILNLVHKYFEQKLEEKHIIVKLDDAKIVEPSKLELFQLKNYVRYLNQNLNAKGGWWEEVQNYRKPSLKQCRSISEEETKKKVSLKNGYLDSLLGMQSEIKLIPVYEINHGKEDAAFIFSINMSNDRSAVIFENASNSAATTTWIFVTKIENYEQCINMVFDYFTDYTLFTKRSSLRVKTVNPPEKFKAENYTFIDHDDLGQWLRKLNKILEQTPEPSVIQFIPGLRIPRSNETRTGHNEIIATRNIHNQLMHKLYDKLCGESGIDNVGTEIHVGTKRIDAVVKGNGFYDIYEVKTADSPFDCVTEALGQLMQYAYLYCPNKIGKMVIVGASDPTKDVEQYLSMLRKNHSLQLYYMKV